MCGITGYVQKYEANGSLQDIVTGMTSALTHRGPDDGNIWIDDESRALALGHRRLSIIDLSPTGAQPMKSLSGRYVISFNGEIYNFKDIQQDLITQGCQFKGTSDTEVLLEAIEHWGLKKTLQKVAGMFVFAVFDKKTKTLSFARDRMGKKPLYFGWDNQKNFAFASELKAILSIDSFKQNRVNQTAVDLYLKWRYVPDPYSIYENIWKLPPSEFVSMNLDQLNEPFHPSQHCQTYWDFGAYVDQPKHRENREEQLNGLEHILSKSVQERMVSDVPLGAFLSGGVDSSLIVSLMKQHSQEKVNTFTIAFEDKKYNEAEKARAIANHLGTNHSEMTLTGQDAIDTVNYMGKIFDEPFGDPSAIPTYHVCRLARENMTVALSGDGGDETFGGYELYQRIEQIVRLMNIPQMLRAAATKILMSIPLSQQRISVAQKNKLIRLMSAHCPDELYPLIHSYWYAVTGDRLNSDDGTAYHILQTSLKNEHVIERMMAYDSRMFLCGDVLTKVDRCSMAHSLEVRSPLLDHRVIEYGWGMDFDLKIKGKSRKYALRELLKRHIPDQLIDQKKQGFSIPHGQWLRDDLREWADHLLSPESLKKYNFISSDKVTPYWSAHKNGTADYGHYLWTIVCLQNWAEQCL